MAFYGALNERPRTCGLYQQCPNTLLVLVFLLVFLFVPWFFVILSDMTGMRQGGTLCTRLFVLFLYQQAAVNIMEECGLLHPSFCTLWIFVSVCRQGADFFFVLSKGRKLVMRNCSVTYIALVKFCICVKDFNLRSYSKIHSVFYYLK